MDLIEDIKKATTIPWTKSNAGFRRLQGPSQATKDRRMNERKLKPPRNIHLVEDDDTSDIDYTSREYLFNEHEIASSIKAANGGVCHSYAFLEEQWRLGRLQSSSAMHSNDKSIEGNLSSCSTPMEKSVGETKLNKTDSVVEGDNEVCKESYDKETILKKCGLSRNAAINGLLEKKKIALNDLLVPNELPSTCETHCEEITSMSNGDAKDCMYKIDLVPHPEDPDVFVQPIQAYGKFGKAKSNNTDFTLERMGKKETVTPRQHYIYEIDDSFFEFRKKDRKLKK